MASEATEDGNDWALHREVVNYEGEPGVPLQGLFVRPQGEDVVATLPAVLIAHTAVGVQEDFILWKLDQFASLGYAAFALDMFGTGRALWDPVESKAARKVLTDDRSRMQARASAALATLRGIPGVDPDRVAALGYCFGGMVVLDLARMGCPPGLQSVVTFHGILSPIVSGGDSSESITPEVLILTSEGDPFVPPEQVVTFEKEMKKRGANWEVIRFGLPARHAFTRPEKTSEEDQQAGLFYDAKADKESWRHMLELLQRTIGLGQMRKSP
ncbi:unnamed protein product [Choristocarpus tenellus]